MKLKLNQILSGLSKRQRTLLALAVAVVAIAALERLVYAPVVGRLAELDQEILLKENQLKRNLKNLATREAVLNAYAPYSAAVPTAGSPDETIGGLLAEIEELAGKTGLALVNVRPKPATKVEVGKQYPVDIEFDTEMGPLMRFIHGLHSSKHLLRVSQLRLDPKAGAGSPVKVYLLINKTVIQ
jgi:Tfp pilus assembly protein PilO